METERSTFTCQVAGDSNPVLLSVSIGEGQLGATIVFRGSQVLVKGGVVIGQLNLGPAADLVGHAIDVESLVNDVSSQTNRMSVRYVLESSGRRDVFRANHQVAVDGELCRFVSQLQFARPQ